MNSTIEHPTRNHRLYSLLTRSKCTKSEQSDRTLGQEEAPQSRGRQAWNRITSILPSQRSLPMSIDEESTPPDITTVSIAVMSAVDDRPFYKLEDPASIRNFTVLRVLQGASDICYSERNRDNPAASRAELSTLIDEANYEIKGDRLLQIEQHSLPADTSLIVINLMPSLNYDSDDSEGDLRSAPGEIYRNPCGRRDRNLSDIDRRQLQVGADAMRARGAELGDLLEYKAKSLPLV